MILGLSIEPGHECTCTTEEEVHLSLASIESRSCCGEAGSFSQLMLKTANSEQLLCTFVHGVIFQQCLDLKLMPGEKVTFTVQGSYRVYVTGYSRSSDSNPLVPAVNEPTVEEEDTDGDDYNNNNTQVKSEPDDSEYFNDMSRDGEMMSNENEELNDRQGESNTQIKSEPEDSDDSNNCNWDEEMTSSSYFEAANDSQEGEDCVVSERHVTSEEGNLHEVAGGISGGPIILTEEEKSQETCLDEVNAANNAVEGSLDNNDSTAHSKPLSIATLALGRRTGLLENGKNKENNVTSHVVEDCMDNQSNGVLSNLENRPNTVTSGNLFCEPLEVEETPEVGLPHVTSKGKTTSDCAGIELMEIQGEDCVVSERYVTSEEGNLHEVAGGISDAPIILTEEEKSQETCLDEVNVANNAVEGSIDNNDSTANSKPLSIATLVLGRIGLLENGKNKENNLTSHVVEDYIDNQSNGVLSNSESRPNTVTSGNLSCEPLGVEETQEVALPHVTSKDKTRSDCAGDEVMEIQGKEKQKAVTTGLKVFLCKHCVTSFSTALDLEVHERSHANGKAFSCKQCGKVFHTKEGFLEHEMIHKEERPFVCKYCEKKFTSRSTLWRHKKLHMEENCFHCNDCEKKFISRQALKEHEKVHAREKAFNEQTTFICMYCEKAFVDRVEWLEHKKTHTSKNLHKCRHCEKTFSEQKALSLHEKNHSAARNFKCSHCEKSFLRKQDLTNHEMIHTGEKPFQCNQCEKCFNQSSTLKTHMKIHTGEKSFKCSYCGEAFRHKFTLVHHERIHTNWNPYKCKYCNKTFNAKSSLKHHEWVHFKEKPFQCKHCDKAFSRRPILTRHERIHTGEKPYECKECEKRFNQRVALIQHQRIHTGERPFKCKYCNKKFAWKGNYLSHEKIHTRKGAS